VTDRSSTSKAPKEQIILLNLLPAKKQESINPGVPSGAPKPSLATIKPFHKRLTEIA
jgi:hypothetical protein